MILDGYNQPTVDEEELHFVPGDPHIVQAVPPLMTPSKPGDDFHSLLKGRVIGVSRELPLTPGAVAELVNIMGPPHSAMAMTLTLVPPGQLRPTNPAGPVVEQYLMFDAAVAMISWGAGGNQTYVEVDFGRGGSLPLYASAVQVLVRRETTGGSPAVQTWGAFITHLTRSSPLEPTRTIRSEATLGVGGTLLVPCPPYAKNVFVDVFGSGPFPNFASYNLRLEDVSGAGIGSVPFAAGANPQIVKLPNDCARIAISNTDAVGILRWRMVFGLAL